MDMERHGTAVRASNLKPSATTTLFGLSLAAVGLTLWLIFAWVPTDANQGAVQRIFYLHVPVAWVSMAAIVVVAVASIGYLMRGNGAWDRLAQSAAETGMVFGALMLITGTIWARPVWGQWWTGEAKLITALILFIIYAAYLIFRAYLPPGEVRKRLSAVIALVGALMTPLIYFSAQLWAQAHPPAVVGPLATEESSLTAEFRVVLYTSLFAMLLLFAALTHYRYKLRAVEDELEEIQRDMSLRRSGTQA